jgi:histidinol-phosphate/aromatic aminotransferase/cobyric acid decarboxylase-like protein
MKDWSAGAMPITGMVGATASLKVTSLVPERRKIIADIREDTLNFLAAKNIEFIPSESNKFMMNARRPGGEFYMAMTKEKIYIGRVWPVWPTWVRVTVGTKDEMAKFKTACLKCYNA